VLNSFKKEMSKSFKMSDLGALSYYLGVEVQQSRNEITICQGAYVRKILDAAGLEESNLSRTRLQWTPPTIIASSAVCATW
jgi:hypothetical protein